MFILGSCKGKRERSCQRYKHVQCPKIKEIYYSLIWGRVRRWVVWKHLALKCIERTRQKNDYRTRNYRQKKSMFSIYLERRGNEESTNLVDGHYHLLRLWWFVVPFWNSPNNKSCLDCFLGFRRFLLFYRTASSFHGVMEFDIRSWF